MNPAPVFPTELLLDEPERGARLVREFYEQYHEATRGGAYRPGGRQHEKIKADFFGTLSLELGGINAGAGYD